MHDQVSKQAAPVVKLQRAGRERHPGAKLAVTIAEAADQLSVSYQTLWRAIRDGEFPGIKIRGRILVPIKAIELLLESVTTSGQLVDVADWTATWQAEATVAEVV
ncbi:helix-turn-helix domain-containing protein [Streptomyces sp. PKU-EA00015]|uniref:helix-turn-helix domain-containing protein n=1 Tax=Streptomyces sp. PKU-EA00015 TaxID=2748326 RepID=UPI0015A44BE4|nr:helix-turn-helix domain-containing protein [Streptomyces sp. PKU-EA00015]NWF28003.1 helix-turn-helix domain-containing protein [Streptomyces sp. PKU-EA00015]